MTLGDDQIIRGPTGAPDDPYWVTYGANFESLATGLLLAEEANIAGFNFYNDRIESRDTTGQGGRYVLDSLGQMNFFNSRGVLAGRISNPGSGLTIQCGAVDSTPEVDIDQTGVQYKTASTQMGMYTNPVGNQDMLQFSPTADSAQLFRVTRDPLTGKLLVTLNGGTAGLTLLMRGLPTSANGLASGYVWRDSDGYLRIVS